MEYIRPDYYDEFSCIGGACPDTCCSGWQIVIDKESQDRYKKRMSWIIITYIICKYIQKNVS